MLTLPLYVHIIFSYLAAVGFGVFLNSPKKTMYIAGGIGMISWFIYVLMSRAGYDVVSSNLLAASFASIASEILSRKMKKPTILFVVPGIVTLVPGLGLYNAMSFLIEGNYNLAIGKGIEVVLISGAIALGVIVVSSLTRGYYDRIKKLKMDVKSKIKFKNNK